MSGPDVWAPLGAPGSAHVTDLLPRGQYYVRSNWRVPYLHRADVVVGDHHLRLAWRRRTLTTAVVDGTSEHEIARGTSVAGSGDQHLLWDYRLMPLELEGGEVNVERRPVPPDRWGLDASGPDGRSWTWQPAGRVFANRTELTRTDDRTPVVTHDLRPVPGRPRSPAGPPTVTWQPHATLAEVLMPIMWTLDRTYDGLLPKAQRIARLDVGVFS